jgi:hypothetical protein
MADGDKDKNATGKPPPKKDPKEGLHTGKEKRNDNKPGEEKRDR